MLNYIILLYNESTLALTINSSYTKLTLESLHENIFVSRAPKTNISSIWSYNEKLVIIDQKIAFVGGLDLCWGRYDSNKHPIVEEENERNTYYYPGCDYLNERQVILHNVEKFYEEQLDRNSMPRMAWHDVHAMVQGPIVSDIVRHFVERWNFSNFETRNNCLVTVGNSFGNFVKKNENKTKNKNINIEPNNNPSLSEISSIKEKESGNKDNENLISTNYEKNNNLFYNNIISDDSFPISEKESSENLFNNKINDCQKEHDEKKNKIILKQKGFLSEDEQLKDQSIDMTCNFCCY